MRFIIVLCLFLSTLSFADGKCPDPSTCGDPGEDSIIFSHRDFNLRNHIHNPDWEGPIPVGSAAYDAIVGQRQDPLDCKGFASTRYGGVPDIGIECTFGLEDMQRVFNVFGSWFITMLMRPVELEAKQFQWACAPVELEGGEVGTTCTPFTTNFPIETLP